MTRIRCQKGILYLRVERCRILNLLFQIMGVDIFQLSYFSIGIIFFGETFMVKFLYNNITIFHWKIAQYIFMIVQRLWRTVQDDTFERSYTKVPFLFIAHTAGSLFIYPYVYKYMIWSVVSSEHNSVQFWSKSRSTFDAFLLLISE